MKPLLAENFITRTEFERAEQSLRRADNRNAARRGPPRSLVRFERPAATSRAASRGELRARRAERRARPTRSRHARPSVGLHCSPGAASKNCVAASPSSTTRSHGATVRARGPGLVVYRDLFFGTDRRKPQVGDEVFPNQSLIALPDASQLVVDTRVREIDLHKLTTSQRRGGSRRRVSGSSAAGIDLGRRRAGTGRYLTRRHEVLSGDHQAGRRGRSAAHRHDCARRDRRLVDPVGASWFRLHAVFDDNGAPYLVVLRDGRPERRPSRGRRERLDWPRLRAASRTASACCWSIPRPSRHDDLEPSAARSGIRARSRGGIRAHRLRTMLSVTGIVFGIATVVTALAIGEGAKRAALAEIGALGIDNVYIQATAVQPREPHCRHGEPAPLLTLADARREAS